MLNGSDRLDTVGDFNADRRTELVIQSEFGLGVLAANVSGSFSTLLIAQSEQARGDWLLTSSDAMVGSGDFNGDGTDDLVVRVHRDPLQLPLPPKTRCKPLASRRGSEEYPFGCPSR